MPVSRPDWLAAYTIPADKTGRDDTSLMAEIGVKRPRTAKRVGPQTATIRGKIGNHLT